MIGNLLVRGMLAGLVAGLLAFVVLKVAGEPHVDRAIAFEAAAEAQTEVAPAAAGMAMEPEPELVSRATQASWGLLTAVTVYGAAFGGLFATAFALCHGRLGRLRERGTAIVLAALGFTAVFVVPFAKYPANPPAVGEPDTIALRTILYFAMIALSLASMIAAMTIRGRLARRLGLWNAGVAAALGYVAVVGVVAALLPAVSEVPADFPATTLWGFRMATVAAQTIMWATLGLSFGVLAEPVLEPAGRHRVPTAAAA